MSEKIPTDSTAEKCPWCGALCMFVERDDRLGRVRIGADCEEHWTEFLSSENDTMGNDYGRTAWASTLAAAVLDWDHKVRLCRKTNQEGVW